MLAAKKRMLGKSEDADDIFSKCRKCDKTYIVKYWDNEISWVSVRPNTPS